VEPLLRTRACRPNTMTGTYLPQDCSLFWCDLADESDLAFATDSSTAGSNCWSSPVRLTSGAGVNLTDCGSISMRFKGAAPKRYASSSWKPALEELAHRVAGSHASSFGTARIVQQEIELNTLVAESWETGNVVTSRFFDLGAGFLQGPNASLPACTVDTLCFANVPQCRLQGWKPLGNHSLSRRLDAVEEPAGEAFFRRMAVLTPTVPASKRIDVAIVWGIRAPRSTPLIGPNLEQWSLDPVFEMSNPWAQRAVSSMCEEIPAELRVLQKRCWISDFKSTQERNGRKFPSRSFDAEAISWAQWDILGQEQLWAENGIIQAVMIQFVLDFAFDSGSVKIMEFKALWDKFVDEHNAKASTTSNMAWHTCRAWVMAEAEQAIINSTIVTIIVAAASGWLCMLMFTGDPTLALIVLCLVLAVVIGLAFFMVVLMGWAIGPIEVISLVVFVGYAVTYSLHVAHIYGEVSGHDESPEETEKAEVKAEGLLALPDQEADPAPEVVVERPPEDAPTSAQSGPVRDDGDAAEVVPEALAQAVKEKEERCARAKMAVLRVGVATLSSAASTIGASLFLLGATMQVFTKLGSVIIAVSVLSCLAALVVLPAMLIIFGPRPEPWYRRLFRWFWQTFLSPCLRCIARCRRKEEGTTESSDAPEKDAEPEAPHDEPLVVTGDYVDK